MLPVFNTCEKLDRKAIVVGKEVYHDDGIQGF